MIAKWPPEQTRSIERFNKMMEDWFGATDEYRGAWYPKVDVKETPTELVFVAELPGIIEKDVNVELNGDVLTIRGKREFSADEKKDDYVRIERSYGSFQRSFILGVPVKPETVNATFKAGLLTVKVPKAAVQTPRKIKVTAS